MNSRSRLHHFVCWVVVFALVWQSALFPALAASTQTPTPSLKKSYAFDAMGNRTAGQSDAGTASAMNSVVIYDRVAHLTAHTTLYAFKSETRLAHDAGVSKSAFSRLMQGRISPSFALVMPLCSAPIPRSPVLRGCFGAPMSDLYSL